MFKIDKALFRRAQQEGLLGNRITEHELCSMISSLYLQGYKEEMAQKGLVTAWQFTSPESGSCWTLVKNDNSMGGFTTFWIE